MKPIVTPRLQLVAATAKLIELEMKDLPRFFQQLGVDPISDWPLDNVAGVLPFFRDQLTIHPSLVGWLAWYWILTSSDSCQLVGGGGFKGSPTNGCVEIGYETRVA